MVYTFSYPSVRIKIQRRFPTGKGGVVPRFTFEVDTHGEGGFAKVRRGTDNDLERVVAVKVLNQIATELSEQDQERFRREARILAKLSHPNIPAIYDVQFGPGIFQIIFQFIEGKNLKEILDERGPCPLNQVISWFSQIASALDHAHSLGIVHRDIKPHNIIVTPNNESAYLVDFGIAISAEEGRKLTKSGYFIGTPGYMSPEQQQGDDVDKRTDLYSLAVTLYEALSGKSIGLARYEPLSINEAIPPQIDELINDCLASKELRLDSARSFGARLAGSLRPTRPLSEVLAHGKLHEMASAVHGLTPQEFVQLPEGQRALIIEKTVNISESGDERLEFALEQLLELVLTRGILVEKEDYRPIVKACLEWGFTKMFDSRLGKDSIRRAMEKASYEAPPFSHEVLKKEFVDIFPRLDLVDRDDSYLYSLRQIIWALLANPACTSSVAGLKDALRKVNLARSQRSRSETCRKPIEV